MTTEVRALAPADGAAVATALSDAQFMSRAPGVPTMAWSSGSNALHPRHHTVTSAVRLRSMRVVSEAGRMVLR
jgi:hypothetical protein